MQVAPSATANEHQEFERDWWSTCTTTFGEEAKQLTYAHKMGLINEPRGGHWPVYDMQGRSVLDIGGGSVSMLLKCVNLGNAVVVDPCPYPDWVTARYEAAGIELVAGNGEDFRDERVFDEALLYNCAQHVIDPELIIATAKRQALTLRIFEWIEKPSSLGHPHTLHADDLNRWIGGTGTVGMVDENGAVGLAYFGCFQL